MSKYSDRQVDDLEDVCKNQEYYDGQGKDDVEDDDILPVLNNDRRNYGIK